MPFRNRSDLSLMPSKLWVIVSFACLKPMRSRGNCSIEAVGTIGNFPAIGGARRVVWEIYE